MPIILKTPSLPLKCIAASASSFIRNSPTIATIFGESPRPILRQGYMVWGGPPAMGPIDGTVVPAAAGGSLPFLPTSTIRVLRNIHDHYPKAWCRYGFVDAFNPLTDWYDSDVIGIDTGITMLMAENFVRSLYGTRL